jgi:hypothetical protein
VHRPLHERSGLFAEMTSVPGEKSN